MAKSKKRLQEAAMRFKRENPYLHQRYSVCISLMAKFIREKGATEVAVNTTNGECYEPGK